jgi:GNAT superfamily N-acetyltransferase
MEAAAVVHRLAFDHRLPWLAGLHSPREDRDYFQTKVFEACEAWGAWRARRLEAFVAFRPGWIDHLYVRPATQSRGLGGALLDVARRDQSCIRLWTFQRNLAARRFYETRGFVAIEETDGARNDEREPDVLYEWRTPDVKRGGTFRDRA